MDFLHTLILIPWYIVAGPVFGLLSLFWLIADLFR